MQQVPNLILERYEFTPQDLVIIKEKLSDPMIQAYIKNTVTEELETDLLAQLGQSKDSYDPTRLLVGNAFNKGIVSLATRLLIHTVRNKE